MKTDRLARLLSLRDPRVFAAALLASVVPLWLTPFLPLVDVPQHAAQVAGLHELVRGNPLFTANFEINWFTPYVMGYLLLFAVSSVLPIVLATKVVLSAALIAVPWVTGALLRELGADEKLKWLAIPASYSFALYWGFLVYVVAIPIALALLVLTIRFERTPTPLHGLGIAAFAVMLFFCHAVALGFCSVLCLTYVCAKNWRNPKRLIACCLPYTAPLPIIALWMARISGNEAAVQNSPVLFGSFRERLVTLFTQLAGLDGFAFATSLAVVATFLFLPLALRYQFTKRPERWLLLVVGVCLYLTFPSYAQGTAYLYQRLAVFLVPLWLIVWEPPAKPTRLFAPVVVSVLAAWCWTNAVRFANFGHESQEFAQVLEKIPRGRHTAGMLVCNASEYFSHPVYLHFHAWYQAVSAGIADNSFAMTHPSVLRYRNRQQARLGDQLAWYPDNFAWSRDGGDSYDYYLVCAGSDMASWLFKEHIGSVALVTQQGDWWLYRNIARDR